MKNQDQSSNAHVPEVRNVVLDELRRIASSLGYAPSSLGTLALNDSRREERLVDRDERDRKTLERLKEYEHNARAGKPAKANNA